MTRQSLLAPGRFLPGASAVRFYQVIDRHEVLTSQPEAAGRTAQTAGQTGRVTARRAKNGPQRGKKRRHPWRAPGAAEIIAAINHDVRAPMGTGAAVAWGIDA